MFQPVGQPNTKQMRARLRSGLGRLASHVEGLHWASTDDSPDLFSAGGTTPRTPSSGLRRDSGRDGEGRSPDADRDASDAPNLRREFGVGCPSALVSVAQS